MKFKEKIANYFVDIYLKNLFKSLKNSMSKYLFIFGIMISAIILNMLFKKNFKENFEIVTMKRDDVTNNVIEQQLPVTLTHKQKAYAINEKENDMQLHLTNLKNKYQNKTDNKLAKKQLQSWTSWDSRKVHKTPPPDKVGSYEQKTNNVIWPIHKQSCGLTNDLVGCEKNEKVYNKNPEYLNEIDNSTFQDVSKKHSTCYAYPLRQQGCIPNDKNKNADIFCKLCDDGKAKK